MKFRLFKYLTGFLFMLISGSGQASTSEPDIFTIAIELNETRKVAHFLTDADIVTWNNLNIPHRKKAFVRYVKQLNEILEKSFFSTQEQNDDFFNALIEMLWIKASFEDKIRRSYPEKVNFSDRFSMWQNMQKSKRMKFRESDNPETEKKKNRFSKYFSVSYSDTIRTEKRFSILAGRKKIKFKDTMVVVFEKAGTDGSAPKADVFALDYDNGWVIKWGDEVHTDIAGSRIFAALGFDVDHPYYFGKNELTVVFNEWSEVNNAEELVKSLRETYEIDISPFISDFGVVNELMIADNKELKKFKGKLFVRFIKCSMEARPDRVKRIGSFLPDYLKEVDEIQESLLAHVFIGNWDTREQNTLLTIIHEGKYKYHLSAVFSDLGTSFGVSRNYLPADFKTGLVNHFGWEAVRKENGKLVMNEKMNAVLEPFSKADYFDLRRMAMKIAKLDENSLRQIIKKTHWPKPIAELNFHKLASRRASILKAFEVDDPHPIRFEKKLTMVENGVAIIKDGKLMVDFEPENNPESFLNEKGRFRNYGY